MRIVSLSPSATEMICAIGLGDQLCGITHECDYPASVLALPKMTRSSIPSNASSSEIDRLVSQQADGGIALYALDIEALKAIEPDVIVTQTLCDVCAVAKSDVLLAVKQLPREPKIINLSPLSLGDMLNDLVFLGRILGCERQAIDAVNSLTARIQEVTNRSGLMKHRPTVVLLEWIDPPFSAGHWNPELVRLAGAHEQIGREGAKSRRFPWQELLQVDPEMMVIACCGYSAQRSYADISILRSYPSFADLQSVRNRRVFIADGSSYFNRPGPRLVDSLELLAHAIDSKSHPLSGQLAPLASI